MAWGKKLLHSLVVWARMLRQKEELKKSLENFRLSIPDVTHLRILVAGQIGAGKSSFINSVNNADLPFEICDVMGLEPDKLSVCQPDDIVKTIFGHVKEGYTEKPLSNEDEHYKETPSLSDQAFCLVYIIDGSRIQLSAGNKIFTEKLRIIRQKISDNGIPQVIVMTKIDEACPLVNKDLKKVYTSKIIKERMEFCKNIVGVPMNSIFPVKNYHDEIDPDDLVDVLILKAFEQIVRFANARLRRGASNE
ncbi:interferon-induced protein 44-like [Rhinichthys klamathensis goyatoka]|uniref:interferon-induced protein 44-like n=1 Tax=Rhinichthys klamathensis goyatoka TaxID=3034132 RepID=UPI0024B5DBD3|nr:interferon-induced protein 44-like [Rhinichthys klamathensis goyatoka]